MSGSNPPPPRGRLEPAARRKLILDAASELFAEHGYDGASMRAIATAAGVTTPVLYDHFESKGELYTALLQGHADALLGRWAHLTGISGTKELFFGAIDAFFAWIEENEQGWRMLFLDSPADTGVAATQRAIQDRATLASAAQFATVAELDASVALDRARLDEFFAEAVKAALNGIAAWWWNNRDVSREQVVELTGDVLWRGIERVTGAAGATQG
jgi:AcrR family transcriptional regulator